MPISGYPRGSLGKAAIPYPFTYNIVVRLAALAEIIY